MKKLKRMYRCIEELKYGNGKTTGCPTVLLRVPLGHDRQCGFTLVELVIVIAIVIILSVISVPIYRNYVDKAKYSEAYALLGTIFSAQKNYFSEFGTFLVDGKNSGETCYEPVLGIDARGNKYFTKFWVDTTATKGNIYFCSRVSKPKDFITNEKSYIYLSFNISKGSLIYERA